MIDHLRLSIPFNEDCLVRCSKDGIQTLGHAVLKGSPFDYGFKSLCARHVERDDKGMFEVSDLYVPYESLPSSFSGMSVKLFDRLPHSDPYLEIKASPAKLMQGHNVYGSDSIEDCSFEMLGLLFESMPEVIPFLNLALIQVRHIDITYSSRVSHEALVPKVIDYMTRIRNGQTKPTKEKKFSTTAYWGGENSRLLQLKVYGKYAELLHQSDQFRRKAKSGCKQSQFILDTVYTPELFEYSKTLMRWEARIKARKLERLGIPINLIDMINHQLENPKMLFDLWRNSFSPIFATFEGEAMPYANDDQIYEMLKEKLYRITPSGKKSYTRANNAMNFFHLIRDIGLEQVKQRYNARTFYDNLKNLTDAGLSVAWLRNIHTDQKGVVIPLVKFCEVDFSQQCPPGYVPPVSQYKLSLVA